MDAQLQQLRKFISLAQPIPEADWLQFAELWKPLSAKRKEILTHSGEKERYLYFVLEGQQRVYYQDAAGREATLVFTYAPSFGGVLDAMLEQRASNYHYETLSQSSFLRASYSDILRLKQSSASVDAFIYKSLSATISGLLMRMVELQCFSSEEKFRALLSRSPHILQQVPHKYLANYLGIDPTNFSKFINKLSI
ncbi:Crp/Fnr family transcriptional regulator [Pedobacter sp. GR22-6]|uniref:Crp/Fnr family transcriptional regulator n=1 Tax=Pedobacter sp. GR22-6 TaxID=3127957 RepID=UPI00307EB14E